MLLTFDDSIIKATADQAKGTLQKDEATLAFNKAEWEKNLPLLKTGAISQSAYDQKFSAYQGSSGPGRGRQGGPRKGLGGPQALRCAVSDNRPAGEQVCGNRRLGAPRPESFSRSATIRRSTWWSFLSDKDVSKLNVEKVIKEGHGIDATVTVDSLPGKIFEGKIGYVQPVTNQNRFFEVRGSILTIAI